MPLGHDAGAQELGRWTVEVERTEADAAIRLDGCDIHAGTGRRWSAKATSGLATCEGNSGCRNNQNLLHIEVLSGSNECANYVPDANYDGPGP
jgi:hypothetical protein